MEPMRAPWATSSSSPPVPQNLPAGLPRRPTGLPVTDLVRASPHMPPLLQDEGGWTTLIWHPPSKHILSQKDLDRFLASESAANFLGFILALNTAIKGRKLSDACVVSPSVTALLDVLTTLSRWVDEIPPTKHTLRYGNPAFRVWFATVRAASHGLVEGLLPDNLKAAATELAPLLAG
eukprot:jgi/Botrbrau1/4591/Bobra.60_2s0077.1